MNKKVSMQNKALIVEEFLTKVHYSDNLKERYGNMITIYKKLNKANKEQIVIFLYNQIIMNQTNLDIFKTAIKCQYLYQLKQNEEKQRGRRK